MASFSRHLIASLVLLVSWTATAAQNPTHTGTSGRSPLFADAVTRVKAGLTKKGRVAVDPMDLSLDENLSRPAVPMKKHTSVAAHMDELAHRLSARRTETIETLRDGEVVVATLASDRLFAPNDTVLRAESAAILKPYADLLAEGGRYKLIVVTHTDNTGTEYYTDKLSEARLHAVEKSLLRSHTALGTLVPYALGASEPLVPNNSMTNRAHNRRVEIYIVPDMQLIESLKAIKPTKK